MNTADISFLAMQVQAQLGRTVVKWQRNAHFFQMR